MTSTVNAASTDQTHTGQLRAAALDRARQRLGLETLETRGRDALDFHNLGVAALRDALAAAFDAGLAAGSGEPTPEFDPADPGAMLDTLRITKRSRRGAGGTWVTGRIACHAFDALVFPGHAESESFELAGSRISKLGLRELRSGTEVAGFDRGWSTRPTTEAAKAIVDLLAAGLAELVFGS